MSFIDIISKEYSSLVDSWCVQPMGSSIDISNTWRDCPLTIMLGDSRICRCPRVTYGQLWQRFLWRWEMQPSSYEHVSMMWVMRQLQCWHSKRKARLRRRSSQWQRLFRVLPVTTLWRSRHLQVIVFFCVCSINVTGSGITEWLCEFSKPTQLRNRSNPIEHTTHVKQGVRYTQDDLYIRFRQFVLYIHHHTCSVLYVARLIQASFFANLTHVHSTHTGIRRSCFASIFFGSLQSFYFAHQAWVFTMFMEIMFDKSMTISASSIISYPLLFASLISTMLLKMCQLFDFVLFENCLSNWHLLWERFLLL